ncbi:hypothetical protein RGUI_2209 [Rhodovulum sp. P5]|uniref:hypothetical protein n=1 Tax=Rhodovulum sp. P5 TaxID=1564506 RepID=UPI0009C2B089|nr:hypothetical protein [Rhodovulum sp. P5]ARE40350.1 hypothetical protein RGUI_2209 [Rhodovulum sp. P5]
MSHQIRHPGPRTEPRRHVVEGYARPVTLSLPQGAVLMQAVAAAMDGTGADCAVLTMDGVEMGPFRFVMPDRSRDGKHAAWYSETHNGTHARIRHGTAIIGRRDGAWWLHCHAVWEGPEGIAAGHLLPDEVTLAAAADLPAMVFSGGTYDVTYDEETNFSFFRPRATRPPETVNAAIATLAPFEDLTAAVAEIATAPGFDHVAGIGSLIGAQFLDAPPMASPISEVLLLPGASPGKPLPTFCVDPAGARFEGHLPPGAAPICVTFEMMLWR